MKNKLYGSACILPDINEVTPDMLALRYGCILNNIKKCREITSIMTNGGKIALYSDLKIPIPAPYIESEETADAVVFITNRKVTNTMKPFIQLIPVNIIVGAGCRKGASPASLTAFIKDELRLLNIDERSVKCIASIDIKRNEPAVIEANKYFRTKPVFFSAEQIRQIEHKFEQLEFVRNNTGAGCVSEPCAYLASDCSGKFILAKTKKQGMTISIIEKSIKRFNENGKKYDNCINHNNG